MDTEKLVLVLLVPLFAVPVMGIGIGPGMVTLEYTPGKTETVHMIALNQERIEQTYSLSANVDHITCEPGILVIPPNEQRPFTCEVRIPKLDLPSGVHEIGRVRLSETAPVGVGIGAVGAVISVFRVQVRNEGPYLIASLAIGSVPQGSDAAGKLIVTSVGTAPVAGAQGTLAVLDQQGSSVVSIPPYTIEPLAVGESREYPVKLPTAKLISGNYRAVAEISYSGKVARAEGMFKIGEKRIAINNLTTAVVPQGSLVKLVLETESFWSEPMEYYIDFAVQRGADEVHSVRDNLEKLAPWAIGHTTLYWETGNTTPGAYDARITLRYEGATQQRDFQNAVTIEPLPEEKREARWRIPVLIGSGVLIILAALFLFMRRRKNHEPR